MPPKTLEAVQDHAEFDGNTITDETIEHAQSVIDAMGSVGVDYDDVVDQLEREGVAAFEKSWLQLLDSVQAAMDRSRA
jgi:transaldolase